MNEIFLIDHREESIEMARSLSSSGRYTFWSFIYAAGFDQLSFKEFSEKAAFINPLHLVEADIVRFHEAGLFDIEGASPVEAFHESLLSVLKEKTGIDPSFLPFNRTEDFERAYPWNAIRHYYTTKFQDASAYKKYFRE